MNGKQFMIGTLFASVLLTIIFIPISTNSQPSTQATAPYDPWADINEDGKIDIKDLAYSASRYGTLGDPAKNVVVTNYNFINETLFYIVPPSGTSWALVETAGFKEMVLGLEPAIACTVDINWLVGNSTAGKFYFEQTLTLSAGRNLNLFLLSVHGTRLWAVIHNPSPSSTMPIWFNYYMTT